MTALATFVTIPFFSSVNFKVTFVLSGKGLSSLSQRFHSSSPVILKGSTVDGLSHGATTEKISTWKTNQFRAPVSAASSELTHPRIGVSSVVVHRFPEKFDMLLKPPEVQDVAGAGDDQGLSVLLVKRGSPPGKGLWSLPGGKLKLGETVEQGTFREVLEETGVEIRVGQVFHSMDAIYWEEKGEDDDDKNENNKKEVDGVLVKMGNTKDRKLLFHYAVLNSFGICKNNDINPEDVFPNDDAEDARWVKLKYVPQLQCTRNLVKVINKAVKVRNLECIMEHW